MTHATPKKLKIDFHGSSYFAIELKVVNGFLIFLAYATPIYHNDVATLDYLKWGSYLKWLTKQRRSLSRGLIPPNTLPNKMISAITRK
jgi:hypothetical protein